MSSKSDSRLKKNKLASGVACSRSRCFYNTYMQILSEYNFMQILSEYNFEDIINVSGSRGCGCFEQHKMFWAQLFQTNNIVKTRYFIYQFIVQVTFSLMN